MSSNESSSLLRKRYESSSQSRLTTFFKPSPERNDAHSKKFGFNKRIIPESPTKFRSSTIISPVKRSQEGITNNSVPNVKMRKMAFQDSPRKEESLVNKRIMEIDLDSSDRDSNLEEELISPQKKLKPAKVAKKPLQLCSNGFSKPSKLPDHSTKKAGLAMRSILSPNKSSAVCDNIPTMRSALEEKKNLNREKRSAVTDDNMFSPVKKLRRTHPVSSSQDIVKGEKPSFKPSFVVLGDSMSNSVSSQESEVLAKNLDSERKIEVVVDGKSTKSPYLPGSSKEKNVSSTRQLVSESMQQAGGPDFTIKEIEIRVEAFKYTKKSAAEEERTEESVVAVYLDKAVIDAKPETAKGKEAEISLQKARLPRIVRRSAIYTTEENGLSISSRITVGLEEVNAGAAVAFKETYKDMETLLDLELDATICPDLKKTLHIKKFLLPNSSHVNFNFYMNRKPVEHLKALRTQQVDVHQYPHALDLHTVIHKILMNGSEHIVLHRAQELIYTTLGFHPSVEPVIRKYYWSVLPQHFDDPNPCSRWEIIRELLEEVLGVDDEDANRMYIDPNKLPTKLERARAVLGVIIQILREDLRCWITSIAQRSNSLLSPSYLSTRLRERNDLPLVARILWPQTSIPHINVICRELIDFHVTALKSGNPTNLLYTEPLVKMMTIVTHMSDLELPLTVRKPEEHMMNLAREIVLHLDDLICSINNSFCRSFGSSELELLLPLIIMNRLKPQLYPTIPEGEELSLTWMMKSYLKIDDQRSCDDVVTRFRSRPTVERNAFLSALSAYFKLFGAFTTWFHMRTKYRNSHSHLSPTPDEQSSTQSISVNIFSRTFTPSQLMDDLRQAKYLLEVSKKEEIDKKGKKDPSKKVHSLYSSISWQ